MTYAKTTTVPVAKSKAEIETLLQKHGATSVLSGEKFEEAAFVAFTLGRRNIRLDIDLPKPSEFYRDYRFTEAQAKKKWEQATRSRWRVFLLLLKAKLEAIELGHTSVEAEFLHAIMLPGGTTFGEAVEAGTVDKLLGSGGAPLLPPWGGS